MIIAIGTLILAGLTIIFYLVVNPRRLMFRLHINEDWFIGGITILPATSGLHLLTKKEKK